MYFFHKQWFSLKNEAYDYFQKINKEYENTDAKEYDFIKITNNIDFIPESADFNTYKIFYY